MNRPLRAQALDQVSKAIEIAGGAAALARSLRVTTQAVCFWRDGKRRIPESLGARIEFATRGQVTRQSLWPDSWMEIWPELAGIKCVPAVGGAAELIPASVTAAPRA
ncbi:hypothetical protein D5039_00200 [Verminephrobacter aporrectodeae subsp. tuberculatae]|uniref:Cro/Cl family transcriptional regulator n=1 Tax=Verminephrobacter aporrectodeae subsp. tuberculatae TaxID=1110392 RepID=A0ABT3KMV6_9BURK|nr:helix-turn-helix domain-containing protein [Verminephrobacter aporrectodeae]MCW5319656.1 hypothetical protein [Verminephrobacter aporrectodeae subsp. tuberculatae]